MFNSLTCYMSEYIDLPLAAELQETEHERIVKQVNASVAAFAERYRNVDLADTFGMYSLFDLSPFDIPDGTDEKEQNFRVLIDCLQTHGEEQQ